MSKLNDVRNMASTADKGIKDTVESFCHIGGSAEDFRCHFNEHYSAFCSLEKILRSIYIFRNTENRLFNVCNKSVVLYGYETWNADKGTTYT